MLEEFSLIIANERRSINDIIICINSREKKLLIQHLNKLEVGLLIKHRNANGENKIRTLVRIYLIEKERIKEKEDMEIILVSIPLNEKRLNFSLLDEVFSLSIKFEKEISCLKMFLPKEQTNVVISEVADKILEQIEKELNTNIPITIALIKNFEALSID